MVDTIAELLARGEINKKEELELTLLEKLIRQIEKLRLFG